MVSLKVLRKTFSENSEKGVALEVLYKKVFCRTSLNSQKNICARVSFK